MSLPNRCSFKPRHSQIDCLAIQHTVFFAERIPVLTISRHQPDLNGPNKIHPPEPLLRTNNKSILKSVKLWHFYKPSFFQLRNSSLPSNTLVLWLTICELASFVHIFRLPTIFSLASDFAAFNILGKERLSNAKALEIQTLYLMRFLHT